MTQTSHSWVYFFLKKKSVNKILKKYLYTHVHRNTSYNSQEAGAT